MFNGNIKILKAGDELGNEMIIKLSLPSGREIFGFGTKTLVTGDWALGPTWCYYVRSAPPFLLDCGWPKWGGPSLLAMMQRVGIGHQDIDRILISHGHEDHDGGLFEVVKATGLKAAAHPVYKRLIRYYPDTAPPGAIVEFPAGCWDCSMPRSHSDQYCIAYLKQRAVLDEHIEEITQFGAPIYDDVTIHHLPGHSPESIAVQIGEEAILVGDNILPQISPHPTLEFHYEKVQGVIGSSYERADQIYGLRAYLRSLKKLVEIGRKYPNMVVLPSHRLFYKNVWSELSLIDRTEELIEHHIQRCADLLDVLKEGPQTAREIALNYFEPKLLEGFGIFMAIREVLSHCELLTSSGDVIVEGDRFTRTGATGFESLIRGLEPLA